MRNSLRMTMGLALVAMSAAANKSCSKRSQFQSDPLTCRTGTSWGGYGGNKTKLSDKHKLKREASKKARKR